MTEQWVLRVIGREERVAAYNLAALPSRILITGANGSIGQELTRRLHGGRTKVIATDVTEMDVTDRALVLNMMDGHQPELVIHMAGAKHAPAGEEDPVQPYRVHVEGTRNVLDGASLVGANVVMASTCKACDPETTYGASKLIAERMMLNANQTVVRYYNVVETSGNVFETWRGMASRGEQIPYTACARRFITFDEAVSLSLWAASSPRSGRFMHWPTIARSMSDVALDLYPEAERYQIPPRRGDRMIEPEYAACESAERVDYSVVRVRNPHDV